MPRVRRLPAETAAPAAAPPPRPSKAASPAQQALHKLGLARDIDLALHLPLRYEDETRITPIASAREGAMVQIEGVVTSSQVQLHPRRQLLVSLQDASGSCTRVSALAIARRR